MWEGIKSDKELASICVLAAVCHGEETFACVLVLEILILELRTIDRFTSCPIVFGKVASLGHETWNDPVKNAALIVKGLSYLPDPFLPCA